MTLEVTIKVIQCIIGYCQCRLSLKYWVKLLKHLKFSFLYTFKMCRYSGLQAARLTHTGKRAPKLLMAGWCNLWALVMGALLGTSFLQLLSNVKEYLYPSSGSISLKRYVVS